MSGTDSSTVAIWAGMLMVVLLAGQLMLVSKFAETGAIEQSAVSDLQFVYGLMAVMVVGLMLYGAVGLIAGILAVVEDELLELDWRIRAVAYLLVFGIFSWSLIQTRPDQAAQPGAYIRVSIAVAFLSTMPLLSLLMNGETIREYLSRASGVVA